MFIDAFVAYIVGAIYQRDMLPPTAMREGMELGFFFPLVRSFP